MKIVVMGATGRTGRHLVGQLLDGGHEVTAFVRNPAKLTRTHERLAVAEGEARDAASFERAVKGQDAVMSAFGPPFRKGDVQEVFMRNLVAAMVGGGVKRLVNLSGWGVGNSMATMPFVFRKVLAPLILAGFFADKERGEALLFASGLDYVNVRPGRLNDKPARGGVKASATGAGLKQVMSRDDLARFMIAQLGSDEWVRRSVVIGY